MAGLAISWNLACAGLSHADRHVWQRRHEGCYASAGVDRDNVAWAKFARSCCGGHDNHRREDGAASTGSNVMVSPLSLNSPSTSLCEQARIEVDDGTGN